ncbi:MAG TPA: dihydropteroate synthase [Candidatus Limnocylindrales bacterium]
MSRPDPTERDLPAELGVVPARPDLGGAAATPSFEPIGGLPPTHVETSGPVRRGGPWPAPTRIGGRLFAWGSRTYVMGIVNVTPDSFSGDGLLAPGRDGGDGTPGGSTVEAGDERLVDAAVALARRMAAEGADLLDIGGESSRPGHAIVEAAEESRRIVPIVAAIHRALPDVPLSVDTTKPSVASAAIDAGAALINDVWGVAPDVTLARLAAERGVPIVLMHNRAEARYTDLLGEVLAELAEAIERTRAAGVPEASIIVDPGFGFGKAPAHNLALLDGLDRLRSLGRPILLGASRKSTLGKVLDLPADERLEATLATTALAVRAGVDIVRVHDVRPNVRVARFADAVVRGWDGPA